MKKILIISPYNPFIPTPGGSPKSLFYRITQLSKVADVTLLTFSASPEYESTASRNLAIKSIFIKSPDTHIKVTGKFQKLIKLLFGNLIIFEQIKKSVSILTPEARTLTNNTAFDLIQIEDIVIAPIIKSLPHKIPKLIFFHNLLTTQYAALCKTKTNLIARFLAYMEYLWIRRFERHILQLMDFSVVLTEIESRQALSLCPLKPVVQIPLAIDPNEYRAESMQTEFPSLVFSGTMSYQPNEEAISYFLKAIFPHIVANKYPGIKFYIVGKNPGPGIWKYVDTRVIITGEVDSIYDYIRKCDIVVVPLLNGGGMRFKILEAFALEKAVVSTPLGAQGIDYMDGKNILIASDASAFSEKVIYLLENPREAERIGKNARKLIEEKYSLDIVWTQWKNVYRQLIGRFEETP